MPHPLKGRVYVDQHPSRPGRVFAITWESSERVVAFSSGNRTSRIRKNRLLNETRYKDTGKRINPDSDFVPEFESIQAQLHD